MVNEAVPTALKINKRQDRRSGLRWLLLLFIVSFAGMLAAFIPTMVKNGGVFLYYGDFNSQQMMFYHHANEMVRAGNFGWDWGTDLGSSFIGSYSFYLLGSPFFWLTTLFPMDMVKYLIPFLLSLKTAVAAVGACAYIHRFVKGWESCCIGGLLYAFSGFQVYNVFFNHFHDVTAFFPFLLLAFEQLTQDKRRGVFALCVAISASVSYFFFVCEVVFVVIYFFIRCMDKEFKMDFGIFVSLGIEAVLGVAMAGIILMPAVYDVLNNPRLNGRLFGNDMLFYGESVRIPRIIQAFFMMSDMPARVNILKSDSGRWASIAGYMPLFAMTGVVAYIRDRWKKKDFAVRMIIVSAVMMCVPFFNSVFVALNSSYYARWYFMPILIMAYMTAKLVDEEPKKLKLGYVFSTAVGCSFLIIGFLPRKIDGKITYFKNYQYDDLYKIQLIVTVVLAAVMGIIIYLLPKQKPFKKITAAVTAIACILTMFAGVNFGAVQDGGHEAYIEHAINGAQNLDMEKLDKINDFAHIHPDNTFFRIDTSENVDNWCLFWGLSSMRNFNSVVAPSIMDLYTSIGQTRDVASRMEPKLYALRSMFSVRYYFKRCTDEDRESPPESVKDLVGFQYVDTQNDFHIYENQFWIPMGFAYDTYTTKEVIDKTQEVRRPNVMLEAVVLNEEQIKKYGGMMTEYDSENNNPDDLHFIKVCDEKINNSCYSFDYDTNGFDAKIKLDKESLVFFSVPYADGWSAQVNGVPAEIEKVNFGLMAVKCPAGDSSIHFGYKTAWLREGKMVTAAGFALLVVYVIAAFFIDRKTRRKQAAENAGNAEAEPLPIDDAETACADNSGEPLSEENEYSEDGPEAYDDDGGFAVEDEREEE